MKLGTLHHVDGYKPCLTFLIFGKGISYGLSKSKKRGQAITKF